MSNFKLSNCVDGLDRPAVYFEYGELYCTISRESIQRVIDESEKPFAGKLTLTITVNGRLYVQVEGDDYACWKKMRKLSGKPLCKPIDMVSATVELPKRIKS